MTIKIFLGLVGSGKTACAVREMANTPRGRTIYSNILTKKIDNNIQINSGMLLKKIVLGHKKTGEEIVKYEFNQDFWKSAVEKNRKINVCLDEIHTMMNARRAMSKQTQCLMDFLSLIRRVVGTDPAGGELTLITQLDRRLDIIAVEMSNQIRFHKCHYTKSCQGCFTSWRENNETPEPWWQCPRCGSERIIKHKHIIEVWHFQSMDMFAAWRYRGAPVRKTAYRHYYVLDIEKYFPLYNTLQWDSLITKM